MGAVLAIETAQAAWRIDLSKGPLSLRPQFDPKGWIHWPDNEDFSTEFMRAVGSSPRSWFNRFRMLPYREPHRPDRRGILVPAMEEHRRCQHRTRRESLCSWSFPDSAK